MLEAIHDLAVDQHARPEVAKWKLDVVATKKALIHLMPHRWRLALKRVGL